MLDNNTIKAVPYTIKVDYDYGITGTETRYRIVSTETGEILDDAQGYGYRTAQKAYAAYSYKTRDKSKDAEKHARRREIMKWFKEHNDFKNSMDQIAFEIAKGSWGPDDKFDAAKVKQLLDEYNLHPNFKPYEILNVWQRNF